mgnify:FL=1
MSKIHVMSEVLANKIAAGEVIERVSSVVKELVENSIDAKSKSIKINLVNAGIKSLTVTDDGIGMESDDALLAFSRHATSKLLKDDDLFFINTLGFRGEALPSIASVSKVILKTSTGNAGTLIEIHGGKLIRQEKSDARIGTTFTVSDLFYNTPARLKYLKSETTELSSIVMYIEKLALTHPEIKFTLTNNDKVIVSTSGSNNLLKTIYEIYGYLVSSNMISIDASSEDYDINGYVCKPSILKSNRNHITTIVNGRIVKNIELNKAINDAYYTYKPDIKYPIVVINIETDPTIIDVNIHPTKQDIKFSKQYELNELVTKTIKEALYKALLIPKIEVKEKINNNEISILNEYNEPIKNNDAKEYVINKDLKVLNDEQVKFDFRKVENDVNTDIIKEKVNDDNKNETLKKLELYPCGLVMGTYIVCENENNMYLIDQHAAQERVNYERYLKHLKEQDIHITNLLIPYTIELNPSDYIKFNERKSILTDMGFGIEEFGINTLIFKSHPTWLLTGYENESIEKLVDLVINDYNIDRIKFYDSVSKTLACKMSVKGNTRITPEAMQTIIDDLVVCDNPYNCPHGRPTIITFTKYELERMFKRVMN